MKNYLGNWTKTLHSIAKCVFDWIWVAIVIGYTTVNRPKTPLKNSLSKCFITTKRMFNFYHESTNFTFLHNCLIEMKKCSELLFLLFGMFAFHSLNYVRSLFFQLILFIKVSNLMLEGQQKQRLLYEWWIRACYFGCFEQLNKNYSISSGLCIVLKIFKPP